MVGRSNNLNQFTTQMHSSFENTKEQWNLLTPSSFEQKHGLILFCNVFELNILSIFLTIKI